MKMTKDEMRVLLQQGVATVTFTKVDGSERVMKCTLKRDVLPEKETTVTESDKKDNPNLLSVWDIDANGWRSFKVDSVTGWDFSA